MSISSFMAGWVALLGSLTIIALVLIAIGMMLCIVKPSDAVRYVGAILGIVIVLTLAPSIIMSAWSAIPLWQRVTLIAIGIFIWLRLPPRRQSRKRERE